MDIEEQMRVIERGASEIIGFDEIKEKFRQGKKLVVKAGFDPSAPDIHLGHTVLLRKMRQFQDLGHQVILIIGDFTAMIGDPSGKSSMRKRLSKEEVLKNAETYKEQAFRVLDPQKTLTRSNSEWLGKLNFYDVLGLTAQVTVARMLERDDFSNRYKNNQPISLLEFLYPLAQGYDSVAIEADIELGGTDQTFNLLMGRTLMKEYGLSPQAVLTMPLLEGLDGVKKMSKSLGNYIGLNDNPKDMFGKTMSIPDDLILRYFTLLTDLEGEEIDDVARFLKQGGNPRDAKIKLAQRLVTMYHSEAEGRQQSDEFKRIFSLKELPEQILSVAFSEEQIELLDLLVQLDHSKSKSEHRRLIEQGGVKVDDEKINDLHYPINPSKGVVIKVGKKDFYRIVKK